MKRVSLIVGLSLLSLTILALAAASPALAQAKSELVVALSSFSAETLDPALQGHNVKYYLSLMFDYLVGTTPDGQPSQAGGLASRWENSADHKRWTFHLRKGVRFHTGEDDVGHVKFRPARDGTLSTTVRGAAPHPHRTSRPVRTACHRHQEPTLIIPPPPAPSRRGMGCPRVQRGQRDDCSRATVRHRFLQFFER